MPILNELRRQSVDSTYEQSVADCAEETLVSDVRSGMRPMQIIENKLGVAILREQDRQECLPQNTRMRFQ